MRFRSHLGVDPIAIVRAAVHDRPRGRIVEGGSTITQQVAKLLLRASARPGPRRGWSTKIHEAVIALRLEHRLTKNEILALYLNLAPYGNQIEGAERASQAYFGRDGVDADAGRGGVSGRAAAAADALQPVARSRRPRGRAQQHILRAMTARGWLERRGVSRSRATSALSLSRDPARLLAPHFVERVLARARRATGRARIETTLDAGLQRTVEGIIARASRRRSTDHHAANVAVVVLDNRTGEWLAWEGSGNYFDTATRRRDRRRRSRRGSRDRR